MHIGCVHTECALNQVMTEDQLLVAAFRFGPSREKEKVYQHVGKHSLLYVVYAVWNTPHSIY